jgi:hypothetical protein
MAAYAHNPSSNFHPPSTASLAVPLVRFLLISQVSLVSFFRKSVQRVRMRRMRQSMGWA